MSDSGLISRILIAGMGMMGASLAHAIRAANAGVTIHATVRSQSSKLAIESAGIAQKVRVTQTLATLASENYDDYDLVVFGIPPRSIVELVPQLPSTRALFTDMSSTRRAVEAAFAGREDLRFVGSHPMCGSENRGPRSLVPGLFENRLCLLIEGVRYTEDDLRKVESFWKSIGMYTSRITPEDHDEVLAFLSHTPHLISGLLALWARSDRATSVATEEAPIPITGGGFRSMARIAGSNPEMWTDIVLTNSENIRASLGEFHSQLGAFLESFTGMKTEDWLVWFRDAREARNFLADIQEDES